MSRRPPGETSSQRMPGTPAISPKRAARLKTKKHREAERLFLAEGAAILEEAPTAPLMVFDRVEQLRRVSALKTPSGPVGVFPFLDVANRVAGLCAARGVVARGPGPGERWHGH